MQENLNNKPFFTDLDKENGKSAILNILDFLSGIKICNHTRLACCLAMTGHFLNETETSDEMAVEMFQGMLKERYK